jgi:SAM-dependent methyltransferase
MGVSTQSQQRGAHGAFRYFGKLAPDVTGAVLDAAAELTEVQAPVVDLMCGSGTTLIEAAERGWPAIGIDANPVATLFARVKTQELDASRYRSALEKVLSGRSASAGETAAVFASTRNANRWFTPAARKSVATLKKAIDRLPPSHEADALLAVLLGRLRRISCASSRTGRLFYDPDSAKPVLPEFELAAEKLLDVVPQEAPDVAVIRGDARWTHLADGSCDLCFCHPPYFALYRYSADVLRFEMEIGGFDRKETNQLEVREGWKSGEVRNLDYYVGDMGTVFREARRIIRPGGVFALVASNSTLGEVQLPVIDLLADSLAEEGWHMEEHLKRPVYFGSAKYHRSARADKVVQQDHVLLCCAK